MAEQFDTIFKRNSWRTTNTQTILKYKKKPQTKNEDQFDLLEVFKMQKSFYLTNSITIQKTLHSYQLFKAI
jgi:hypothetical protein